MLKKILGILLIIVGIGSIFFALSMDYIRGVIIHFGLSQVILLLFGFFPIGMGFYLLYGKQAIDFLYSIINRTYQVILAINRVLPFKNVLLLAVVILTLISLVNPIKFSFNYLTYPYPFEYRDAAEIHAAKGISQGINLYSFDNYPEHIYLYGILYPVLLSIFINLAHHPILVAKIFEFVFLVILLGASYYIFRKQKASVISSIIGIIILLNSTCLLWKNNGIRPDLAGLVFALINFTILVQMKINMKMIFLFAGFCTLSFFFKQYMLFSAGVIAVYLFLFESKKKGVIFISLVGGSILIFLLMSNDFLPLYYEYSILHHTFIASKDTFYMLQQLKEFLNLYWVLFVLLSEYFFQELWRKFILQKFRPTFSFLKFDEPLIKNIVVSPFSVGIIISAFLLIQLLGKHRGNNYTYFGELMLPFLLYLIIPKLDSLFKYELSCYVLHAIVIIFCILPFSHSYATNFDLHRKAYLQLTEQAEQCNFIYEQSPIMAVYKIENEKYPILNNGHTEYATTVIPADNSFFAKLSSKPVESFYQKLDAWNSEIEHSIEKQKFDCIFADSELETFSNYHATNTIDNVIDNVWMNLSITVLVPNSP